jgi:anti-sigma-K factor RskA
MAPDKHTDLAALYALGALDGQELADFQAHLDAGCAECVAEVRTMEETAALLPRALPQSEPRPEVRERLMRAVGADAPRIVAFEPKVRRRPAGFMPAWGWGALAAAATLVVALGAATYVLWSRLHAGAPVAQDDTPPPVLAGEDSSAYWKQRYAEQVAQAQQQATDLNAQLADALEKAQESDALRPEVAELKRKLGTLEDLNKLLGDPETQVALFSPTDNAKEQFAGAAVRVVWNPAEKRAFLLGNDLPQTVGDQVYEMWTIASSGVPVPAGWFRVGPDGIGINSTGEIAEIPTAQLFAMSSEPNGPVDKPTTVVMVSK